MEVFISWSGEYSHKLAITLKDWLSNVIQTVDPWVSSEDIEKGDRWSKEIAQKLDSCNIGIICLTKENFQAPWINFEAGALSKKLGEGKVCTLLLDLKPTDIKGPLTQFQATIATDKEDMWKLVKNINNNLQDKKIKDDIVFQAFGKWWGNYLDIANTIVPIKPTQSKGEKARTNEDILEEILANVRGLSKEKTTKEKDKEEYIFKLVYELENLKSQNTSLYIQNEELKKKISLHEFYEVKNSLMNK